MERCLNQDRLSKITASLERTTSQILEGEKILYSNELKSIYPHFYVVGEPSEGLGGVKAIILTNSRRTVIVYDKDSLEKFERLVKAYSEITRTNLFSIRRYSIQGKWTLEKDFRD